MYKFIAMIWNEEDVSVVQAAEFLKRRIQKAAVSWKNVYKAEGLSILHSGEQKGQMQAVKLANNGGIILGKLFKISSGGNHLSIGSLLGEDESQKILATSGKHLIEYYWGRYVAFLRNQDTRKISVLKAPIEGWRCYYADYDGVAVYFSCFGDVLQLGLFNLSVNWHYIALYSKFFMLDNINTALNEIHKLQPGECRHYKQYNVTNILYWDPVKIASEVDTIEDPREAEYLLRLTITGCVSAWAEGYEKIIHKLSGGLDSSIILGCLRESRDSQDISCLNFFPASDKSGDERFFARLAARHTSVQLIEKELDASKVRLEQLFDISPLATPEWYLNAMDRCGYEARLAHDIGASALFAGEGGDGLFYQSRTHFVTSDYFIKYGLIPNLFRIALNNARLLRKTVWSVLFDAVKDRLNNSWKNELIAGRVQQSSLLNLELMQTLKYEDILPSSLEEENDLPYGKRLHIVMMGFPNRYHYSAKASDFLEVCYPLLSQPIIELCLRIPSYILTTGGRDRGLARMAFRNDLPSEILRRESKGGVQNYVQEILDNNLSFIKEILMDGTLVKKNLLDRNSLERVLTGASVSVNSETVNILRHVCTEIWLRKVIGDK